MILTVAVQKTVKNLTRCFTSGSVLHMSRQPLLTLCNPSKRYEPMLSKLLHMFRPPPPFPVVAPDQPFTAIGDIHGRVDLLRKALDQIAHAPIICVGDYVDRGDHSADVLRLLITRPDIHCLAGNHEAMMLAFIDDPAKAGPRWLRYGGLQTLASFGVYAATETSDAKTLEAASDALKDAMGPQLIQWMRHLPTRWHSGNVAVVHAGADPSVPLDLQSEKTLLWGHPDFTQKARDDGVWVVHGHTIVDQPCAQNGRIAIDTGAYATGRLTAAHVSTDGVRFQTIS
jgi:serine/threonine protein phosphatase 1